MTDSTTTSVGGFHMGDHVRLRDDDRHYCTAEEGDALYGRRFRVTYVLHGWGVMWL